LWTGFSSCIINCYSRWFNALPPKQDVFLNDVFQQKKEASGQLVDAEKRTLQMNVKFDERKVIRLLNVFLNLK